MKAVRQKTILLGLNELNFEYIEEYIKIGNLENFATLFTKHGYIETTSESDYKLLEPWIQWVTIHTGKTFEEHGVFRLGDIVNRPDLTQLWELGEAKGLKVGGVSPFNARNNLKNAAFFVPDPWTQTEPSGSQLLIALSRLLPFSKIMDPDFSSLLYVNSTNKLSPRLSTVKIFSLSPSKCSAVSLCSTSNA